MKSIEDSGVKEPLLKPEPEIEYVSKVKSSFRQYLLEFVMFCYMTSYIMGDVACYQYMYSYASVKLNFDVANFTSNGTNCNVNKSSAGYQLQQEVTALASSWQLYFALASGIPGLFLGVVYGTYSDRIGRRFLMVLSTVMVACRITAYIIAIQFKLSIYYVIPGYILEGIGGSFNTMSLASAAYTADITVSGKSRSIRLMMVFGLAGLSMGFAFLSTGYSIKNLGFKDTFIVIVGINFFTLLGIALLPESRSGKHMKKMTFSEYLSRAFQFYTKGSNENPYRYVYFLCGAGLFFSVLGTIQRGGIEVLYLLDSPFCWNSVQFGNYQSISSVGQNILSVATLIILLKFTSEEMTTLLFNVIVTGSFILEAFSKTAEMMYAVAALGFTSIPLKLLQKTMASSITDSDQQGALFASLQAVESLCNTAGTVLCNLVYELTVSRMQGAVFLYMAGLCLISCGLMVILWKKPRRQIKMDKDCVIN